MHSVRGQLTDSRSTESSCSIQAQVQSLGHIPYRTQTSRHTREVLAQSHKADLVFINQRRGAEVPVVYACAAREVPVLHLPACCGEETDVEKVIVCDEILLTLIDVLLPHATNTCRDLPVVG